MNKLFFIVAFALFFISASLTSATVIYTQTWEDGTTSYLTFDAGDQVTFLYESYTFNEDNWVETEINLLFRGDVDEPVEELLYDVSPTGTYGSYTIDTTDFIQGHYIIQGTATDLVNGGNWTSLLEFFVYSDINDTDNNPPYFLPIEHFVFDLAYTTQEEVLRIADYAVDPDGDALWYNVDTSGVNTDILDCAMYPDAVGTVACEFYAVGTTSFFVIASDDEFPVSSQVFITIINSSIPEENEPPYFLPIEHFVFDLAYTTQEEVLRIADYVVDPDGDDLTFAIDTSATATSVLDCALYQDAVGTVACEFYAVGTTSLLVIADDGEFAVSKEVFITIINSTIPEENNPPYFDNLEQYYSYNIDLEAVNVVDLAQFAVDPDGDELTFGVETAFTNPNIVDCSLDDTILHCELVGVGQTSVLVSVSDGEYTAYATVYITVFEIIPPNNPPYFIAEPEFVLVLEDGAQSLVDLNTIAVDPDGDELFFTIQAMSNDGIVSCSIQETTSVLTCTPLEVGETSLRLQVSDGELTASGYVHIKVISEGGANRPPYFIAEPEFVLVLEEGTQSLVDMDTLVVDPDGDALSFALVNYSVDGVVDCSSTPETNVLVCTPLQVGAATLTVSVTDGEFTVEGLIHVTVISECEPNHPPQLLNVPDYFIYDLSYNEIKTLIPDVTIHGYDPDGDDLTYSIDTTQTDEDVVVCTLVADSLRCQLKGVGLTTLQLIVSDGQLTAQATITVQVIDTVTGPTAIIQGPSTMPAYELFTFDGSASFAAPGKELIKYQWTIRNAQGVMVSRFYGPTMTHSLPSQGVYTVELIVVDEDGRTDTAVVSLTITYGEPGDDEWVPNKNFQVNSIQVIGYEYERASPGDDLQIFVTVTNHLGRDVEDVRATFFIPEFGIRFKSAALSLDDGDKTTISIFGFVPPHISTGVYYPEVSVVADDVRRSKIAYLEVTD
jgi:hypothetical protein